MFILYSHFFLQVSQILISHIVTHIYPGMNGLSGQTHCPKYQLDWLAKEELTLTSIMSTILVLTHSLQIVLLQCYSNARCKQKDTHKDTYKLHCRCSLSLNTIMLWGRHNNQDTSWVCVSLHNVDMCTNHFLNTEHIYNHFLNTEHVYNVFCFSCLWIPQSFFSVNWAVRLVRCFISLPCH